MITKTDIKTTLSCASRPLRIREIARRLNCSNLDVVKVIYPMVDEGVITETTIHEDPCTLSYLVFEISK